MAGTFELKKSSDQQFRFVLKADTGETLLTSELYKTKGSAEQGVAAVQTNCVLGERYELKRASSGQAFFNLKAANHQVIGTSPLHANDAARDADVARLKAQGALATIKDLT